MSKETNKSSEERSIFAELDDDFLKIRCCLEEARALNAAMYSILDKLLDHDKAKSDTDNLSTLVRIQEHTISTIDEELITFWNKVSII